jgi:hypothetical protein
MKVLRVIKVIILIAAIIALLVPCAGKFFIMRDACKYQDQGLTPDEVHSELDNYDFAVRDLFSAKAEGEGEGEAQENQDTPAVQPEATAAPAPVDEPQDEPADDGEYSLANHNNIIIGLMKAANAKTELKFMSDFDFGENTDLAFRDGRFTVNTWVMIAFCGFVLFFLLHLISKKHKTLWGLLLMLFGFLIFVCLFAAGYILANLDIATCKDVSTWRLYTVGCVGLAGFIFGLGWMRCGARQMRCHWLKKRRSKKA